MRRKPSTDTADSGSSPHPEGSASRAAPPPGLAPPPQSGVEVAFVRLAHAEGLPLPAYQTEQAAGLDLVAAVPERGPIALEKGKYVLVPTGLILALPAGFEAQVRPRSGLALRHGVTVLNSPGTIDADYRGELQVLLVNLGEADFVVRRGERIAQLVIAPVVQAQLTQVRQLDETARGSGGFGSTGMSAAARPRGT